MLVNQSHWCYIKSLLTVSLLAIHNLADKSKSLMLYQIIVDWESFADKSKPLMFISSHCWLRVITDRWSYTYKAIKLQIIKSSNCKLSSHQAANYKIIKLSFIHYTKSSSCKLQSHQAIIYTLFSHQVANYKVNKLSLIQLSSHQAVTIYNIYTISRVFLSVIAEYFFALFRSRKLFNTKLYN